MWKLEQIQAKNLCAFKDLNYSIQHNRATLIFGNNLDNDSQGSNGSGKSALIEAIAIALTGNPLRKVSADEIINDCAEEAVISAILTNDMSNERVTINRRLSRKQPQIIQVIRQTGPYDTDVEEVAQASVADYNKYVLDLIGLSKEDIYSNFILSKHKYTSFLSSSDKDKKEIINRFSNGILVDESLAALQEDMLPIQEQLKTVEGRVSMASGKVSAINEQINTEIAEATEKSQNKSKRITDLKDKITAKREYIRELNESKRKADDRWGVLEELDSKLQACEKSNTTLADAQNYVNKLFKANGLEDLDDYVSGIESWNDELIDSDKKSQQLEQELKLREAELAKLEKTNEDIKSKFEDFNNEADSSFEHLEDTLSELASSINKMNSMREDLLIKIRDTEHRIAFISNQLAGVIACPKCKHEFTLSGTLDIDICRKERDNNQNSLSILKNRLDSTTKNIDVHRLREETAKQEHSQLMKKRYDLSEQVTAAQTAVVVCQSEIKRISSNLSDITSRISQIHKNIDNSRTALFDQAFGIIDEAIKSCDIAIKNADINIENAAGNIVSYEESIKEIEESSSNDLLENLKASKERYEQELNKEMANLEDVNKQLADYKTQEATFIEFKTHLANTKINDLSRITNEFLERIGSDIRISFSGYTVLKSGKIRDKISISLIRDGVDCGSFDKFSEGEKARVNLANILAMHKLTNVNCLDGKGLDLLVLDEILDATDESGLANIFEALNSLQITSLVVSHGNIAENYPYKLVVNKQNGVSFING